MFDIIADSACDFTPEMAQKIGVEIVPFYVSLDGEHYRKEGKEIAVRDFYQFMVDKPLCLPQDQPCLHRGFRGGVPPSG